MFQFQITITKEDYFAYNQFNSLESVLAKKQIQKNKTLFWIIIAVGMIAVVLLSGFTTFSMIYIAFLGLFGFIYTLRYKHLIYRNLKKQINQLEKMGKLPFSPVATIEFFEDKLVEKTPSTSIEQTYNAIERVCVLKDSYIFIYKDTITAYLLPIPQLKAQADLEAFMHFLTEKCTTVEYY